MKRIKKDYNSWAHQYDNNVNPTRDLDKIITKKILSDIKFSSILELGCGTGKNTEWLITKADQLTALDFSDGMLELARKKISDYHITFIKADLNEMWPLIGQSFELVISNLTLEHIENIDHIFNSAANTLVENGKYFVCELHPEKQLAGSKARFESSGNVIELETFIHLESDYLAVAEKAGLTLLNKKDWYDENHELPRLISFLFEKQNN